MLELWVRGYYETLSQQSNICSHQIVDASCTKRSTTKPPCVVWFEWFSKWSTCHWSQKKTHWHSSLKVSKERKRGQCSVEAMKRAIKAVEEGNRLRGAARMFNVPVETLWMRVASAVPIQCRPGPKPILAVDEEAITSYCVKMAEMVLGWHGKMFRVGYLAAEKSSQKHPWSADDGIAGKAWFEGFMSHHPMLKL